MDIRYFTASDIESIALWLDTSPANPWSLEAISEIVAKAHYRVLVSVSDNNEANDQSIAGLCIYTLIADECNLLYVAVNPQHRRQGIGGQLLNYLFDDCRQQAICRIFLEVRESNLAAIALYSAAGFIQSGVRENYYPALELPLDGRESALLFDLSIY